MSATKARNNFFELLNQVALGETQVIIEKDKKEIAILSPKKKGFDWDKFKKALQESQGILKDYTEEEIAPLRRRGSWGNFGKWDEDNN